MISSCSTLLYALRSEPTSVKPQLVPSWSASARSMNTSMLSRLGCTHSFMNSEVLLLAC